MSKVKKKTKGGRQSAVNAIVSGVAKDAKEAEKYYDKYTDLCNKMKGRLTLFVNLPEGWGFEYRDDDACFVLCFDGYTLALDKVHEVLLENGVLGYDDLIAHSH